MTKRALVTGVTGQDGAYLCKRLIERGYEVHGAYRRSASSDFWRLDYLGIADQVKRVPFDLLEPSNILRAIDKVRPDEIYNLAAQSFVALSFEQPIYTTDADALGPLRILEAIRTVDPSIRFYQASTSEMFGKVQETPQRETTPFYPRSPYGVAKLYAHWITVNYRESYNLHATSGILFNHESPLRGTEFVTRKITSHLALIKHGRTAPLELGNLDAHRDWGFAGDYVEGMIQMVQADQADDFVLSTGEMHTVREFVIRAAEVAGFRLNWEGEGANEFAKDDAGNTIVQIKSEFYRPAEVDTLLGDSTKARTQLGWKPTTTFQELVEMMMIADLDRAAKGILRV
jgi:GDPmannose 4,6-dehydratase